MVVNRPILYKSIAPVSFPDSGNGRNGLARSVGYEDRIDEVISGYSRFSHKPANQRRSPQPSRAVSRQRK